jgi:hypothetical protein
MVIVIVSSGLMQGLGRNDMWIVGKSSARIALTWSTRTRGGSSLRLGILPILLHLGVHTRRLEVTLACGGSCSECL